jgi:hypothetical protein
MIPNREQVNPSYLQDQLHNKWSSNIPHNTIFCMAGYGLSLLVLIKVDAGIPQNCSL